MRKTSSVLDKMIDDTTKDLAAVRAENERLNQIINAKIDNMVEGARVMTEQKEMLAALRAENQRLREALQNLADKVDAYRNGHGFVGADLILATEQARAALATTPAATAEEQGQ